MFLNELSYNLIKHFIYADVVQTLSQVNIFVDCFDRQENINVLGK